MIISFARTTPALLAGAKTVTRRDWKEGHANKFKPGMLVDAYDKSPRNGGRKVAVIRILSIQWGSTRNLPMSEWIAEGFNWMSQHGIPLHARGMTCTELWDDWFTHPRMKWVVRFELVEVIRG